MKPVKYPVTQQQADTDKQIVRCASLVDASDRLAQYRTALTRQISRSDSHTGSAKVRTSKNHSDAVYCPRKRRLSWWKMAKANGWSATKSTGGVYDIVRIMTPVAAAASVPSSVHLDKGLVNDV